MLELSFKQMSLSKKISAHFTSLEVATKQLKVMSVGTNSDKSKIVISTNWLNYFNFKEGSSVIEQVIGYGKGLTVRIADAAEKGVKKVYGRDYKNRDRETLMDIRHQQKLEIGLASAKAVHITFEMNCITIQPIFDHEHSKPESSSLPLNLKIPLALEGGIYAGIIDAIQVIKAGHYECLTISCDDGFVSSKEYTLFTLQLRRLGYVIEQSSINEVRAYLSYINCKEYDCRDWKSYPSINIEDVDYTPAIASLSDFNFKSPLDTFLALSSGVDGVCLESEGFSIDSLLEWCPPEARDYKRTPLGVVHHDKTELGAICAAINCKSLKKVFNEDIFKFKLERVRKYIKQESYGLFHISLECSDFSNAKNDADKQRHMESLETSRDMIFPLMDLLSDFENPPQTVLLENVTNFQNSIESKLLTYFLQNMGYTVHSRIIDAKKNNGYTMRKRCYMFATVLNETFTFAEDVVSRTKNAWVDIIKNNMHMLKDTTHTKSVQLAITSGRLRAVNEGDEVVPTIMRSQDRGLKDAVYIHINGRYYKPNVDMLKMLMSIDGELYDTSLFSNECTTQFIGQSVDIAMHEPLLKQVKRHILSYCERASGKMSQLRSPVMAYNPSGYPMPPAYF